MSKQENQEQTNQAVEIEDLTVEEAVQQEVKAGPRKFPDPPMKWDNLKQ